MTAKTLMRRHNSQPGVMQVGEQICQHFLENYHQELMQMSNDEIVDTFGRYVYEISFG